MIPDARRARQRRQRVAASRPGGLRGGRTASINRSAFRTSSGRRAEIVTALHADPRRETAKVPSQRCRRRQKQMHENHRPDRRFDNTNVVLEAPAPRVIARVKPEAESAKATPAIRKIGTPILALCIKPPRVGKRVGFAVVVWSVVDGMDEGNADRPARCVQLGRPGMAPRLPREADLITPPIATDPETR